VTAAAHTPAKLAHPRFSALHLLPLPGFQHWCLLLPPLLHHLPKPLAEAAAAG
jgi:hypothetical protein